MPPEQPRPTAAPADEAAHSLAGASTENALRIEVHAPAPDDRHSRLLLTGPLTDRTTALVRAALRAAAAGSGPWLLVDIGAVNRLDRSGLAVLVAALHHVRRMATDGCLHLTGPSNSPSARALATSGLWKALPLTENDTMLCGGEPLEPGR